MQDPIYVYIYIATNNIRYIGLSGDKKHNWSAYISNNFETAVRIITWKVITSVPEIKIPTFFFSFVQPHFQTCFPCGR